MKHSPEKMIPAGLVATSAVTPTEFLNTIERFARQAYADTAHTESLPMFLGLRNAGPPEIYPMPVQPSWAMDQEVGRNWALLRPYTAADYAAIARNLGLGPDVLDPGLPHKAA